MFKKLKLRNRRLKVISTLFPAVSLLFLIGLITSYLLNLQLFIIATFSWLFITPLVISLLTYVYYNTKLDNIIYRYMVYLTLISSTLISSMIEIGTITGNSVIKFPLTVTFLTVSLIILYYNMINTLLEPDKL